MQRCRRDPTYKQLAPYNEQQKIDLQSNHVASLAPLTTDSWCSTVSFIPHYSAPPCDACQQTAFRPFKPTTTAYVQAIKWLAYL